LQEISEFFYQIMSQTFSEVWRVGGVDPLLRLHSWELANSCSRRAGRGRASKRKEKNIYGGSLIDSFHNFFVMKLFLRNRMSSWHRRYCVVGRKDVGSCSGSASSYTCSFNLKQKLSNNGEPTLLVHCFYQMLPLNHKRTTSSWAPPIFLSQKNWQ